jgi:PAS domain S-box-containing protein
MANAAALQILVVEDDPGMALLVGERLEGHGWDVTTVGSAAECRECAAGKSFDVILLDRGLPDCDGASLIDGLLDGRSDRAIVMLTGADSAESATETLKLGAWDYVVKRPDLGYLDELPGVVRRCAERIEWRREQERLRGEMDLLLTAIRSAGDVVLMIDSENRVRFWNAAAERLLGWSTEEVQGQPLVFVPEDRRGEFDDLTGRARSGQQIVGVETVWQQQNGSHLEVSMTLTAVRNPDGTVRAFVIVGHDISERKELERDRADFVAMLTHDIKNPITTIFGYASELGYAKLAPEYVECVEAIERSAEMINTLVSNFLISTTIERGTLRLVHEPVPVTEFLQDCVRQFRPAAARVQIELSCQLDVGAASVMGDRLQLERALSNLIGNALKFTPAGGSVTVEAEREAQSLHVRVRDTGPGISPEELPHVFEKYRREKGTHRIDGAGLGLFITRNLVEAHGGSVSAASQPGVGSTFEIRLPIEPPAATA